MPIKSRDGLPSLAAKAAAGPATAPLPLMVTTAPEVLPRAAPVALLSDALKDLAPVKAAPVSAIENVFDELSPAAHVSVPLCAV